jgi:hypothetical protein
VWRCMVARTHYYSDSIFPTIDCFKKVVMWFLYPMFAENRRSKSTDVGILIHSKDEGFKIKEIMDYTLRRTSTIYF